MRFQFCRGKKCPFSIYCLSSKKTIPFSCQCRLWKYSTEVCKRSIWFNSNINTFLFILIILLFILAVPIVSTCPSFGVLFQNEIMISKFKNAGVLSCSYQLKNGYRITHLFRMNIIRKRQQSFFCEYIILQRKPLIGKWRNNFGILFAPTGDSIYK